MAPLKAKLHQIECHEDELVELPDAWIPGRLEHNDCQVPLGKAYTLYHVERA